MVRERGRPVIMKLRGSHEIGEGELGVYEME